MLLHTNHHRMQHCGAVNSVLTEKVILKPHKNGVEIYYYETAASSFYARRSTKKIILFSYVKYAELQILQMSKSSPLQ